MWVVSTLVVPVILDFIFLQGSVARFSRIVILIGIAGSLLTNPGNFLSGRFEGIFVVVLLFFLYGVGTVSAVTHGGVITPNVGLLIILLFAIGMNFDLYDKVLNALGWGCHILVAASIIVMILRLNPRNSYLSSVGYPVFFDFIGIPGRNYGIFSHPNTLGQVSALSFLFILARKQKIYLLALPLLCIMKAGSRTSIIGLCLGAAVFGLTVLFRSKKTSRISNAETPIVIGFLLFGIFMATSLQFLEYIKFLDPGSFTGRISIWQSALALYKSSSLFGLGWGWEQRAIDSQLLNIWAVSAHNALLEILFSSGLIGLILFLIILVKAFVYFPKLTPVEKALIVCILISGTSESIVDLQYPTFQTVLFFIIVQVSHLGRRE